jgi:nicotinamide mononucleotide transporter
LGYLELTGVVFGFLYLILIIYKKPVAWFFGIISAALYCFIFFTSNLFFQSNLQLFYIALGLYGWWNWGKQVKIQHTTWHLKNHLIGIFCCTAITILIGAEFNRVGQALPYLDALISVFSVFATYLTTKAIYENWYYWIIINLLSIVLFHSQQLYLTEFLFMGNLILSFHGLFRWRKVKSLNP